MQVNERVTAEKALWIKPMWGLPYNAIIAERIPDTRWFVWGIICVTVRFGLWSREIGLTPLIPGGGRLSKKLNTDAAHLIFYSQSLKKKIHFLFQALGIKNAPYGSIQFLCRGDGIRTHDAVAHIQTFQACSFNHSDTPLKVKAANIIRKLGFRN